MNIKFINKTTVAITESLHWYSNRPEIKLRQIIPRDQFVDEFKKLHPSYNIESIEGPENVCNFRTLENASATWTLTVSKKGKASAKKAELPTPKKAVPKPKPSQPSAKTTKPSQPSAKTTKSKGD